MIFVAFLTLRMLSNNKFSKCQNIHFSISNNRELLHGDEKNELEAKTAEKFKEEQDRIDVEMAQLSTSVVTQI